MNIQKILLSIFALLILCCVSPEEVDAQGKGKGGPPSWAPAHGYRAKTRHVYFPEHNFYFDMSRGVYIFLNGGNWVIQPKLPLLFAKLDLARATQIQLELDSDSPHKHNADHKLKFKVKPQAGGNKTAVKAKGGSKAGGNSKPAGGGSPAKGKGGGKGK